MEHLQLANRALASFMTGGFVLLVVFLMNAVALAVALWQVHSARNAARTAKTAAEASMVSAEQAWSALSTQLYQVALADAAAHVTQIENAVSLGDWQMARIRAGDLRASLARLSAYLTSRMRNLLLGDAGLVNGVYGQLAERCKDPEYIVTIELEESLATIATELNALLGKRTHTQGGALS